MNEMSSTLNTQIKIEGSKEVKDRLGDLSKAIAGRNDLMKSVWEDVGIEGSNIFSNIFDEQGKRFGGWDDLSPVTKLLRPKGARKKYTSIDEVKKDKSAKILMDTNIGRQSFMPGSTGNVLDVGKNSVTIGSRMKRMKLNNSKRTTTFTFGKKQQSRFESSFSKTLPGAKPATTPTGRKSRAKKNWNKEYYALFNGLKKKDGQTVNVPERRIQPTNDEITAHEKERIFTVLLDGVDHVIKKVFEGLV